MTIDYSIYASLFITSIIVMVVLFFCFKDENLKYTEFFFPTFSLLSGIFPILTFSSYMIINAIFDLKQSDTSPERLTLFMIFAILLFWIYLLIKSNKSKNSNIKSFIRSIRSFDNELLNSNESFREQAFFNITKSIKQKSINKHSKKFEIYIHNLKITIRLYKSFSEYLGDMLYDKKRFQVTKARIFVFDCNANQHYDLFYFMSALGLSDIKDIEPEHFKVFEMLNI